MPTTEPEVYWNGRLDNAPELATELSLALPSPQVIAVALYRKWGIAGLGRLIGDWNLALCFPQQELTVLAVDYAGIRPLYYRVARNEVYFSGSIAEFAGDLDPEYLADYVCFGKSLNRTPYRGVRAVPSGHAVVIERGREAVRSFWQAPVEQDLRYRRHGDYAEQLYELFSESVRARLPEKRGVCPR